MPIELRPPGRSGPPPGRPGPPGGDLILKALLVCTIIVSIYTVAAHFS